MGGAWGLIWGNAALAVLCTPLHNDVLDSASFLWRPWAASYYVALHDSTWRPAPEMQTAGP